MTATTTIKPKTQMYKSNSKEKAKKKKQKPATIKHDYSTTTENNKNMEKELNTYKQIHRQTVETDIIILARNTYIKNC